MKIRVIISILSCILLAACGEDRRLEYADRTNGNKWIEETMRAHYYWYANIPESGSLNYYNNPTNFFNSLLASGDGTSSNRYSWIDVPVETTTTRSIDASYSYGFAYNLSRSPESSSQYYARVLFVVDGSPAQEAGLKRGDWIVRVNNVPIVSANSILLDSGEGIEFTMGEYNAEDDYVMATEKTVGIAAARAVSSNPILYHNTYTTANNRKVGYLVYNSFNTRTGGDDNSYNNQLLQLSNEFKSNGANEFVLDLRYCSGGTIDFAKLMATILAPASAQGKVMSYVEYNDQNSADNYSIKFDDTLLNGGGNLGLSRLYVIIGNYTSYAPEVLISALQPYYDEGSLVLIGEATAGKFVDTQAYTHPEGLYPWTLHIVTSKIFNSNHEPENNAGFTPTYEINELDFGDMPQLGNPGEHLLSAAIGNIEGTYPGAEEGD